MAPAGDRQGTAVVTDAALLVALVARPGWRRPRYRPGARPCDRGEVDETTCCRRGRARGAAGPLPRPAGQPGSGRGAGGRRVGRRALVADGTVGDHLLPAGSVLLVSPWATHRHPRHWERPDRFDPDRFTPEREAGRHRYAYLPFGGGPRACLGAHFAMLEAVVATATIVGGFRLETTPAPVPLATGITLRPAAAVPCALTPATAAG
jgi:Cytochrome P450